MCLNFTLYVHCLSCIYFFYGYIMYEIHLTSKYRINDQLKGRYNEAVVTQFKALSYQLLTGNKNYELSIIISSLWTQN